MTIAVNRFDASGRVIRGPTLFAHLWEGEGPPPVYDDPEPAPAAADVDTAGGNGDEREDLIAQILQALLAGSHDEAGRLHQQLRDLDDQGEGDANGANGELVAAEGKRHRPRQGWQVLESRAKPRRAGHWAGKLLGEAKTSRTAATWASRLLG
jgi:hypothetical protein